MATTALGTVLNDLRRSLLCQEEAGRTDGELLESFAARRDEAAFEVLLRRHGPMVLGVCRRVLRNEADAEDAFQATFLVLVRKAGSIRPRSMVGNWLYGVAHSTALKARAMSTKRLAKEREAAARPKQEVATDSAQQLQTLLDQELKVLPDKYRAAIVLCDLEGKSIKEAARHLGCPPGTVGTRLARGRRLLSRRLARHGLTLSGGVIATILSQNVASACVPLPLVASTIKAASLFAAGQAAPGVACAKVAALAEGMLKTMLLTKLKVVAVMLVALVMLGVGGAAATHSFMAAMAADPKADDKQPNAQAPKKDKVASDQELLQGAWTVVSFEDDAGALPDEQVKRMRVVFKQDKVVGREDWLVAKDVEAIVRIDPAKKPKTIDLRIVEDEPAAVMLGIYDLKGDELRICVSLGLKNVNRPAQFATAEGSRTALLVLKRQTHVLDRFKEAKPNQAQPLPDKKPVEWQTNVPDKKPVEWQTNVPDKKPVEWQTPVLDKKPVEWQTPVLDKFKEAPQNQQAGRGNGPTLRDFVQRTDWVVTKVDVKNGTINVRWMDRMTLEDVVVPPTTRILVNGKANQKLTDLKPGMYIELALSGDKATAFIIDAHGNNSDIFHLNAVDVEKRTINVHTSLGSVKADLPVAENAKIVLRTMRDGKKVGEKEGKLADLKAGMRISVQLGAEGGQGGRIIVKGIEVEDLTDTVK